MRSRLKYCAIAIIAGGTLFLTGCGGGSSDSQPTFKGTPDPSLKRAGRAPLGGPDTGVPAKGGLTTQGGIEKP